MRLALSPLYSHLLNSQVAAKNLRHAANANRMFEAHSANANRMFEARPTNLPPYTKSPLALTPHGTFVPKNATIIKLTEEEMQILRLVCEAKGRKEIAEALYMSEGTVKRRISEILAKTGYRSILKLAVHAVSNGYIVPRVKNDEQQ